MIFLTLFWLCIGICVGLIANAAHLRPATWQSFGWLRLSVLSACCAFGGGWIGILFLGRPFASALALWIAVLGSVSCRAWSRLMVRRSITPSRAEGAHKDLPAPRKPYGI